MWFLSSDHSKRHSNRHVHRHHGKQTSCFCPPNRPCACCKGLPFPNKNQGFYQKCLKKGWQFHYGKNVMHYLTYHARDFNPYSSTILISLIFHHIPSTPNTSSKKNSPRLFYTLLPPTWWFTSESGQDPFQRPEIQKVHILDRIPMDR